MAQRPKIKLSELREIGWEKWDPIGIRDTRGEAVDEYDSYILRAAATLWQGLSEREVADYLISVASERMGLSVVDRAAAAETARAIKEHVEKMRDAKVGPGWRAILN
jgi:hypothetical protein